MGARHAVSGQKSPVIMSLAAGRTVDWSIQIWSHPPLGIRKCKISCYVPSLLYTPSSHSLPSFPPAPAQSCLLGSGGSPGPAGWPASPAAAGSETAYSCSRDQNGKGGHLARLVSCGVSPTQPKAGAKATPIHTDARGLGLARMGTATQVPRS